MSQPPKETETVFTHRDRSNPQLRLLEETFGELEPQERIERISAVIVFENEHNRDDDAALDLVRSLQVCFMGDLLAYRAHLRCLYSQFVGSMIELSAPKLREEIFTKVIVGWNPHSQDAEACFLFFCNVFFNADRPFVDIRHRVLRRIILEVFRKDLENPYIFTAEELIPWVLKEETPDEIARIILHGMVNTKDGDRPAGVVTIRTVLATYQSAG